MPEATGTLRDPAAPRSTPPLTRTRSILAGATGFAAVSLVVFASWAWMGRWMYRRLGEGGAYAVWAIVFVAGAGGLLGRLVFEPALRRRFPWIFAGGFLGYAAAWCAAWFLMRNAAGEWIGSAAGSLTLGAVLLFTLGGRARWPWVLAGLFAGHSAGYFLGSLAHTALGGTAGKLAWGLCYGLGFGAGIGLAIHEAQSQPRRPRADAPTRGPSPSAPTGPHTPTAPPA